MGQPEVSGLIVSLAEPIIDRIFHHRDVYVHPTPDASTFLSVGSRVFFYDTLSQTLIGEAAIAKISSESRERLAGYGHRLFLSLDEFEEYARERGLSEGEPILVMELERATKYMNAMKCPLAVPRAGLMVTYDIYNTITDANR